MFVFYHSSLILSVICCSIMTERVSACPRQWFGEFCQYKCHCKNLTCKPDGNCNGTSCESGWFGYKCQNRNLIVPGADWVNDEKDSTCNKNSNIKTVSLKLAESNIFTWLWLIFNATAPIRHVSLEFQTSKSVTECLNQRIKQIDKTKFQIWCSLNVTVYQVNITGEGVGSLCSVYVNGGRNVALKQPTNQTSTYGKDNTWKSRSQSLNAVDGNTNGSFDKGSCTHTAANDITPSWTVTFNTSFVINKFILFNRDSIQERLRGFRIQAFHKNSTLLMQYRDSEVTLKNTYHVNRLVSEPTAQVKISKENSETLTLCEVEIFGDCPKGYTGLQCNETCSNGCPYNCDGLNEMCSFVCFGNSDPPVCQTECLIGRWGLNCVNNCTGQCWESNCDKKNGLCLSGCHGYMDPPYCTQVCMNTRWGLNCSKSCSPNCQNSTCDRLTGTCHFGCLPGYVGPDCINECQLGHYGSDCKEDCTTRCVRGNCSKNTGLCLEGCHGYSDPPNCTVALLKNEEISTVGAIVGAVITVLLILCLASLGFVFWRRHRVKTQRPNGSLSGQDHSMTSKYNAGDDINSSRQEEEETTMTNDYCNIDMSQVNTTISISNLNMFMTTHKNQYFIDQFKIIPSAVNVSMEIANKEENKNKNRYKNICTYDHSRVNLKINSAKNEGDYINASYIKGFGDNVEFIASQGPNKTILNDFVRMLWEQYTEKIVMLTNIDEDGKTKCEQYWPDIGKTKFEDVKVKLLTTETFPNYTIRLLELGKKNEESRQLTHYQFHAWPDKGVPVGPWSLVDFVHKVTAQTTSHLTVVHCSAGVGRTGTFIALLNIMKQASEAGKMNFFETVAKLRQDRMFMVQTAAQYEFLHKASQTALLCMNSTIAVDEVKTKINKLKQKNLLGHSGIEAEWKNLCDVCTNVNNEDITDADDVENVYQNTQTISSHQTKNRFQNILPKTMYRPLLNVTKEATCDYINAVIVQGIKQKDLCYMSQLPMHQTVDDFWRLVTQYKINIIVSFEMNERNKDKTIAQYFPTEATKALLTSMFEITSTSCKQTLFWDDQRLTVKCTSDTSREIQEVINITSFFKDSNAKKWLSLFKHIHTCLPPAGKIVFICKNGAQYSGLACVLTLLLERMDIEMKVNVPLVVGSVKLIRPEVIQTLEEYKLIYDVLELLHETDTQHGSVGDRFLKDML